MNQVLPFDISISNKDTKKTPKIAWSSFYPLQASPHTFPPQSYQLPRNTSAASPAPSAAAKNL